MAKISRDDIAHLAELGKVNLSDKESDQLVGQLTEIIGYITQLTELNTDGVEPTYQVSGLYNVWREDSVDDTPLPRNQLLDLALSVEKDQIKVPKVL